MLSCMHCKLAYIIIRVKECSRSKRRKSRKIAKKITMNHHKIKYFYNLFI
jgi:hypothetical protein